MLVFPLQVRAVVRLLRKNVSGLPVGYRIRDVNGHRVRSPEDDGENSFLPHGGYLCDR